MEDTKLKEKCPHCGNHLILMESINNKHELWIVKRCLECGDYPSKEVVLLKDYNKTSEEVVDELIGQELRRANQNFPMFQSAHEGYAVLLEEVEEMVAWCNSITLRMSSIWNYVKHNSSGAVSEACALRTDVMLLIQEAVQVGAMAQKFIDSEEKTE